MKKIISLLLVLSFVLCFAACGGNETPDENVNNNSVVDNADDNSNDDIVTSNKEITLEDVKNAPVSPESDFEVVEVDGGVAIDGYLGDEEIVVIPEKIGGKNVIRVDSGFVNANAVKAVRLSNSVEVLGNSSFINMENLEIFIAGSNLKTIESCAIAGCKKLRVLELNEGLQVIEAGGISINPLLQELYIPNSVTKPDGYAPETGSVIICEAGSETENFAKLNGYEYRLK